MSSLLLRISNEDFEDIAWGDRYEVYRVFDERWERRLKKNRFSRVTLVDGSRKRKIVLPWDGFEIRSVSKKFAASVGIESLDRREKAAVKLVVFRVDALKHELAAMSPDEIRAKQVAQPFNAAPVAALSPAAVQWLASGERCASSETLFERLTGVQTANAINAWADEKLHPFAHTGYPGDLESFWRCNQLLVQCPELRQRLPIMAAVSQEWARFVERWDDLVAVVLGEVPLWPRGAARAAKSRATVHDIVFNATEHDPSRSCHGNP